MLPALHFISQPPRFPLPECLVHTLRNVDSSTALQPRAGRRTRDGVQRAGGRRRRTAAWESSAIWALGGRLRRPSLAAGPRFFVLSCIAGAGLDRTCPDPGEKSPDALSPKGLIPAALIGLLMMRAARSGDEIDFWEWRLTRHEGLRPSGAGSAAGPTPQLRDV